MKFSFRKLPLTYLLLLTGIILLLALLYVPGQLYLEKENRVSLLSGYSSHIQEFGDLASLMSELGAEAEYSLEFALNKGRYSDLVIQRISTDRWIHKLEKSGDTSLVSFLKYTLRNGLISARTALEGDAGIDVQSIMNFYYDAIWQLNIIHSIAPSNKAMLQPLNAAVESQKLLFEMETWLAMTRNKIYASLRSAHDTPAIVLTAGNAWRTLKNYEAEFLTKAPTPLVEMYNDKENEDSLQPAFDCLDYIVVHHQFDSAYTAPQWWAATSGGIKVLRNLYLVSQQQVQAGLNHIYESEMKARNLTLLLLAGVILLIAGIFIFTIRAVNKKMKKLPAVSAKASAVEEDTSAHNPPKDNVNDLILAAIYRAGKANGATATEVISGVNGHAVPMIEPTGDNNAVPGTNGKILNNKQETGWKMNEVPNHVPLELNKSQENTSGPVDDDLANYAIPKPAIVPVTNTNGLGSKEEVVKENIVAKAEQRTDSLTTQMNELMDAAAIESGRLICHKHIFKLNDLVSEMVYETGYGIPAFKISLRKNAPLSIYGDRARIAQVLSNLLHNAMDHCPDSDSIIVSLEEKGQTAVCSVEDFGTGIAKDQQEKIFEKFYRVNNTNGVSRPGLGLGLYIAIGIIKQHHGEMWVKSEPGLGSTFYFSLPVSTA